MAYNAVPSVSPGDTITAAWMNTYIGDNFAASVPDIFTAKGDIAAATGANVASPLAVGSNGQLLTADSSRATGLAWGGVAAATAARYTRTTTLGIAGDGSAVIMQYNTQVYDPGAAVTTGASWAYTVPSTGYYLIAASALLESSSAWGVDEYCKLGVYVGGSLSTYIAARHMQAAGTYQVFLTGAVVLSLSATNSVNVRMLQNSGSDINVAADGTYSHISIARLF